VKNTVQSRNLLVMCKDTPVYDIEKKIVLSENLMPGCVLRGTKSFAEWMQTRYSVGSNVSARRMMLRAFGEDSHSRETVELTRALSLSDCYWLKQKDENVRFDDVTPYFNKEWDGEGAFKGGSISTLFVNGASDKKWIDGKTLIKFNSAKESAPYKLCGLIGIDRCASIELSGNDLLITNFTSPDRFLESMEQSGFTDGTNSREKAVEIFGACATALFAIDYLTECDDRHWGNYGFIRNADTGKYESMAPYYDFDWVWTGNVVNLPDNAFEKHGELIKTICVKAKAVAVEFEQSAVINNRADELLERVFDRNAAIPEKIEMPDELRL